MSALECLREHLGFYYDAERVIAAIQAMSLADQLDLLGLPAVDLDEPFDVEDECGRTLGVGWTDEGYLGLIAPAGGCELTAEEHGALIAHLLHLRAMPDGANAGTVA